MKYSYFDFTGKENEIICCKTAIQMKDMDMLFHKSFKNNAFFSSLLQWCVIGETENIKSYKEAN